MHTTVNKLLILTCMLCFFLSGCSEDVVATDSVSLNHHLSQQQLMSLKNDIQRLADAYGMNPKGSASMDKLENRDVYFLNFYKNKSIVFSIHDLKGDGLVTAQIYGSHFTSKPEYQRFSKNLKAIFDDYSDRK